VLNDSSLDSKGDGVVAWAMNGEDEELAAGSPSFATMVVGATESDNAARKNLTDEGAGRGKRRRGTRANGESQFFLKPV
jgi:hypothetical protein